MPGAAISVGFTVEHGRERAVDGLPLGERRRLVDSGADQRMAKLEPRSAHVHQPRLFGFVERHRLGTELRRGAQHGRELAAVVGAGDEQERLRLLREPIHARKECVLDAGADRNGSKHRLGARELSLAQGGGKLEQGERVAARLGDQPVAELRRELDACRAVDQGSSRGRVEPAKLQLREPGRLEAPNVALASAEEHDDALGFEPPGDEDERVCGCVVEPLGIVDEAQERPIFRGLGEQAQDCERDEEAVLASPRCQAERSTEGGGLRSRKALDVPENRADDLVQSGERELRLRFHPGAAEHAHVAGLVARVLQKRRLADARLAGDDEDGAPRRASAIEKLADTRAFRVSPVEHVR